MKNNHILRLESQLKKVLIEVVSFEVKNKVQTVTITDCDLTNDLSFMSVYYTVTAGTNKEKALAALNASKGFIKKRLTESVSMRQTPELRFIYDETYEKAQRIEELLHQIKYSDEGKN